MYFVYVLKSVQGDELYVGSTNNVERRLAEHNKGAEISTRRYMPWDLYYYEAYPTEKLARLREKRLKYNGNSIRELKKRLELFPNDKKLGSPSTTFVNKSGAGFTLVELIIYTAILSILLVALVTFAGIVQDSRARFRVLDATNGTANRVMNVINTLIRNSDGFVADSSGTRCVFNNKLWLYYATSSASHAPPGCLGEYASGAISVEPYSFSGATTTKAGSPWYAWYGEDLVIDGTFMYGAGRQSPGWHVVKRYLADMQYDTGFGSGGAVTVSGNYAGKGIAKDGVYLYIVGGHIGDATTNSYRIEKRRVSDGSLVTTFDDDGIITSTNAKVLTAVALDATHLYSVGYKYNSGSSQDDWYVEKRRLDTGALDTSFDTDGYINGFANGHANDIVLDIPNGHMYVAGYAGGNRTVEKRLLTTGAYVTAFDTDGYWQSSGGGAASSGPSNGSTFSDDSSVGSVTWSNPSSAQTSNNGYATAALATGETSHYLKALGFGFSIPSDAIVQGIKLEVEAKANGTPVIDNSVRIVQDGSISGNENVSGTYLTTSDVYYPYGGASDLWGLTWTPTQINSATFGAVVSYFNDSVSSKTTSVDHMRITVYYFTTSGQFNAVTIEKPLPSTTTYELTPSEDTRIVSLAAATTYNYGRHVAITTGYGGAGSGNNRTLLRFDVSTIPKGSTIQSATLTMTCSSATNTSDSVTNAYPLLRAWAEGEGSATPNVDASWDYSDYPIQWGSAGASDTTSDRSATSMGSQTISSCSTTVYSWTLEPSIVSQWVEGTLENFGMVLIGDEGVTSVKTFQSINNVTSAAYRPILTLVIQNTTPTAIYLAGDNGSDVLVEKRSMTDASVDTNFGSSGAVLGNSTSVTGYDIAVDGEYVFTVGYSDTTYWYIEKRNKTTGKLVPGFGTGGSIITDTLTDIAYAIALDQNYLYVFGSWYDTVYRQYVEKRFRSSGALDKRNGVRLLCFQNYPNLDKGASCNVDPPSSRMSRQDLTDPLHLFVGPTDLTFATTTVGSGSAVESLLNIRYRGGSSLNFGIATVTASTTALFQVTP